MSTRPNPLDGTAVIPLPPGMTLDQFFTFQASLVSVSITAAIAFGIVVWDYFYLLRQEYTLYRVSKLAEWRTLAPWSFVALRCSGVVSILASLCVSSFQSTHCQLGTSIFHIGAVVVIASTGIAFGYRIIDIWKNRKEVSIITGCLYVTMVIFWIAVASQYRAINGPPTPFGSNCGTAPFVSWAPISHASSVVFNVAILIMGTLKFVDQGTQQSRINYLAYRNSMIYIAITTATSVAVLVVQSLDSDYQVTKRAMLPYSTLITATMGSRVFLNLKLSKAMSGTARDNHLTTTPPRGPTPDDDTHKAVHFTPSPNQGNDPTPLDVKLKGNPYTTFPSPPFRTSRLDSPSQVPPKSLAPRPPQNPYTSFPSPPLNGSTSDLSYSSPKLSGTGSLSSMVFASPGKHGSPASFKSKFSLPDLGRRKKNTYEQQSGWV
ncbi:hypothetical protein BDZ94DRAFT_1211400 [Collybia nuda]|uniref:Uncharacterized protein n=1 Tax=Collybia nuda TaxID=64659 RepID=A0A9P5YBR1_9AGAR|nr:hypothetical protein BDZ94DRAFT_1211400 [Collybia nuda]